MFYRMYLSSVCKRRQWPDPLYEPYRSRQGYMCKVRVNNREYSTDVPYASEELARDGAAQKAYLLCRNFSHNDGMYPGQRPGQSASNGVVQGLPVAIGAGRRASSNRCSAGSYESASSFDGLSSGGNSPKDLEETFEQQMREIAARVVPSRPAPRRSNGGGPGKEPLCYCRRGSVLQYSQCAFCLREKGWAC